MNPHQRCLQAKVKYLNEPKTGNVVPQDKMKNITYAYANEMAGLITRVQFVWIKNLIHINYAVAHAQCLRQHM